jgi:hypothetical protein
MEAIRIVASVLALASLALLVAGLIRPEWVLRRSKKPTRWKAAGLCVAGFLAFSITSGLLAEEGRTGETERPGKRERKSRRLKDLSQEELDEMRNALDRELVALSAETLDSTEIADRQLRSLRPAEEWDLGGVLIGGWLYRNHDLMERDEYGVPSSRFLFPGNERPYSYTFYRVRIGDSRRDSLFSSHSHTYPVAMDGVTMFSSNSDGLFRQHISASEPTRMKSIEGGGSNVAVIDNVILFDGRLYYTQAVDTLAAEDMRRAAYNICSIKADGSDDRKLTGRVYQDFCIYRGAIYARNNFTGELEKLDLNGTPVDNYGRIGYGYFDLYGDFAYYLDEGRLHKIDIETGKRQRLNGNDRAKTNPVIARGHLFFSTQRSRIGESYLNSVGVFGDLCSIDLESGELETIYSERLCEFSGAYNGVLYCREFIESDPEQGRGSVANFQINMDGTDKRDVSL